MKRNLKGISKTRSGSDTCSKVQKPNAVAVIPFPGIAGLYGVVSQRMAGTLRQDHYPEGSGSPDETNPAVALAEYEEAEKAGEVAEQKAAQAWQRFKDTVTAANSRLVSSGMISPGELGGGSLI